MNLCCRSLLVLALCLPAPLWAEEAPPDPMAHALLRHLRTELPTIRDTLHRLDAAPDRAWFGGKAAFQDDIDGYLDEALALVLPDTYPAARKRLAEIDRQIVERQLSQANLKLDMTTAPAAPATPEATGLLDSVARIFTPQEAPPKTREDLARQVAALDMRPPDPSTVTRFLSGGNQQKVVLGRWMARQAQVYLFDDPTVGVDIGARAEIYQLIRGLAEAGASVIVASGDPAELIGLCDRVAVMMRGRVVAECPAEGLELDRLVALTTGAAVEGARHVAA